jgi:hypothetical protein
MIQGLTVAFAEEKKPGVRGQGERLFFKCEKFKIHEPERIKVFP